MSLPPPLTSLPFVTVVNEPGGVAPPMSNTANSFTVNVAWVSGAMVLGVAARSRTLLTTRV